MKMILFKSIMLCLTCLISCSSIVQEAPINTESIPSISSMTPMSIPYGVLIYQDYESKMPLTYIEIHLRDEQFDINVNQTIREATENWITEDLLNNLSESCINVYSITDRYLSYESILYYRDVNDESVSQLSNFITIDMRTGKQVRLSDLFNISKSFIEAIFNASWLEPKAEFASIGNYKELVLKNYDLNSFQKLINECSQYNYELNKAENYKSVLIQKSDFAVMPGLLIIKIPDKAGTRYPPSYAAIPISEIEEYLLVTAW